MYWSCASKKQKYRCCVIHFIQHNLMVYIYFFWTPIYIFYTWEQHNHTQMSYKTCKQLKTEQTRPWFVSLFEKEPCAILIIQVCQKRRVTALYTYLSPKKLFSAAPSLLSLSVFPSVTQPWIVMHRVTRPAGVAQILIVTLSSDGNACTDKGWSS